MSLKYQKELKYIYFTEGKNVLYVSFALDISQCQGLVSHCQKTKYLTIIGIFARLKFSSIEILQVSAISQTFKGL